MPESQNPQRWRILGAMLTGTVVGVFGTSMVSVALPNIMDDIGIGADGASWLLTVYILCVAVCMPIAGWLGDMYGFKRIFVGGLVLLTLGFLLAAISRSFWLILIARVIQGIGTSPTMPSIMSTLPRVFRKQELGRALGFWATVNSVSHGIGPVLGGGIVQYLGWSGVFFAMAGLGLVAAFLINRIVPVDIKRVAHKIDLLGASLMLLIVLTIMINLTQGSRQGFSSPISLILWVVFIVCVITFRLVEARVESPFVNLALFKNRLFITASIIFAISFFCLFGMHFLLPQFLIRYQGIEPAIAGIIIATLSITAAFTAPFAGRFSDTFGQRWPCAVGMGFVGLSGVGMLFWQYSTPSWQIALNLIILGLGIGMIQSPVTAAATLSVKDDQRGVAMGIFNMFRMIGASLGSTLFAIMLISTLVSNSLSGYHLISYIIIGSAIFALLLALNLQGSFPLQISASRRR